MKKIIVELEDMELFIENSYDNKQLESGKFKGWTMFEIDTNTGNFDTEKSAIMDYKMIIVDLEGTKYEAVDGYYNLNGHQFDSAVEFTEYIPKEKSKSLVPTTVTFSIDNGGDGSVYNVWFLTADDAKKHQKEMNESWGELCIETIQTYKDSDVYKEAILNSKNLHDLN